MLNALLFQFVSVIVYIAVLISGIKKKISLSRHILIFLFFVYIVNLVSITLFPLPIQKEEIEYMVKCHFLKNNFVPFKSIIELIKDPRTASFRQVFGNIVLFIPMGFLVPLLFNKMSTLRKVVLVGFISSFTVEFLQFLISFIIGATYKITDIDDIILNTIGTIIGFILFRFAQFLQEKLL